LPPDCGALVEIRLIGMGFMDQGARGKIVLADQGCKFTQQFAPEGARKVIIVIGNLDECTGTHDYFFASYNYPLGKTTPGRLSIGVTK